MHSYKHKGCLCDFVAVWAQLVFAERPTTINNSPVIIYACLTALFVSFVNVSDPLQKHVFVVMRVRAESARHETKTCIPKQLPNNGFAKQQVFPTHKKLR